MPATSSHTAAIAPTVPSPRVTGHLRAGESSGTSSASSSIGLEAGNGGGVSLEPIAWERAVQLCNESTANVLDLARQASLSADLSALDKLAPAAPRTVEFLVAALEYLAFGKAPIASEPDALLVRLADAYGDVAASRQYHRAFLTALVEHGGRADLPRVFASIQAGVAASWPGADPDRKGCRAWFTNHTDLLRAVYLTARNVILPTEDSESTSSSATATGRLPGASDTVACAAGTIEVVAERLNHDLATSDLGQLRRHPGYLLCLAQTLSISSVVDSATLPESLTAQLNACFAACTSGIGALLSHEYGLPVVRAIIDDLARGVKARRHVLDRMVSYARDPVAKHAVIAMLEHSAKVSSRAGSELLVPAPSDLFNEALPSAGDLEPGTPTLVVLACHQEATAVVPVVLRYADGYHAVAFADALQRFATVLGNCIVPGAADALRWAMEHPTFASAVIAAHSRLGRDLVVRRDAISTTAASKTIEATLEQARSTATYTIVPSHKATARICFTFAETGACPQDAKCPHLHVEGAVVSALCDRDCCVAHGSDEFRQGATAAHPGLDGRTLPLIDSRDHSKRLDIRGDELSFTAGLAVYFARDFEVGLPLETDALCRQHFRCSCHKPQQCKYVHLCRKRHATLLEEQRAAEAAAAPAPTAASAGAERNAPAAAEPKPAKQQQQQQQQQQSARNGAAKQQHGARATAVAAATSFAIPAAEESTTSLEHHPATFPVSPAVAGAGGCQRAAAVVTPSLSEEAGSSMSDARRANLSFSQRRRKRAAPSGLADPSGSPMGPPSIHPSPSIATSNGAARPFVTHVDAEPTSFATPVRAPSRGYGGGPGGSSHLHHSHNGSVSSYDAAAVADEEGDLRTHRRQTSTLTASDVSESPIALAFARARRTSGDAHGNGHASQAPTRSPSIGYSDGSAGLAGPYGQPNAFRFGPGHSTPGGGYSASVTPTTNRTR